MPDRPRKLATFKKRIITLAAALCAPLAIATTPVQAAWPEGPVTILVPYAPGGNTDIMARLAAQEFQKRFGQPFVVENRAGAGGALATQAVARAAPDGRLLLWGTSAQISILPFMQEVNYDPIKDLTPVAVFGSSYSILGISSKVPATDLASFLAYVRSKPGVVNYASPGTGTYGHLVSASFAARAGLQMEHVPYKGGAPAMTDLIGGQIQIYFGNASELLPHRANPDIRILAVSTPRRVPQLPDTPAVAEVLPGFSMAAWNGMMVPTKTPAEIVSVLTEASLAASQAVAGKLAEYGIEAGTARGDALAAIIREEHAVFAPAIKAAGLAKQ